MGRPFKIVPPVRIQLNLPQDLKTRLDLLLYSPSQQRVPYGAYTEFFTARLEEFFQSLRTKD